MEEKYGLLKPIELSYIKGKYEMLHYIPKKSLKVLLVLKCLSNKKSL